MSSRSCSVPSILSFPVELLKEIAKHSHSLPALRLVCKLFNDVVAPEMFSQITIAYKDGKQDRLLEVLESIAVNEHPAISHAWSLTIGELGPSSQPKFSRNQEEYEQKKVEHKAKVLEPYYLHVESIKMWLPLAISRLCNVTSIRWSVNQYRLADWSRDCVISSISQKVSLTNFEVSANVYKRQSVNLSSIPPVESLSVYMSSTGQDDLAFQGIPELIEKSSERLRHLHVKCDKSHKVTGRGGGKIPLVSYLLHNVDSLPLLKHLSLGGFEVILGKTDVNKLRSLESLSVKDMTIDVTVIPIRQDVVLATKTSASGNLWDLLTAEKLHLKEIIIDEPNESFMEYLQSYSGLQTLILPLCYSISESTALSFYRDALRKHTISLQKLEVKPEYEGNWCFGEHCVDTLTSLTNLRHLSISVIADSTETVDIYELTAYDDAPDYEYNPSNNAACQVLQMATSLPKLELLSINSAGLRTTHNGQHIGLRFHKVHPVKQILASIMTFGPLNPMDYRFTVETAEGNLWPRMIKETGEYRYRLITGRQNDKALSLSNDDFKVEHIVNFSAILANI